MKSMTKKGQARLERGINFLSGFYPDSENIVSTRYKITNGHSNAHEIPSNLTIASIDIINW